MRTEHSNGVPVRCALTLVMMSTTRVSWFYLLVNMNVLCLFFWVCVCVFFWGGMETFRFNGILPNRPFGVDF